MSSEKFFESPQDFKYSEYCMCPKCKELRSYIYSQTQLSKEKEKEEIIEQIKHMVALGYTNYSFSSYTQLFSRLIQLDSELRKYATDTKISDSAIKIEYSDVETDSVEGTTDMSTGAQYVANPRYQPNQRKRYKHLRMMLQQAWKNTGNSVTFDIDERFKYNDVELAHYLHTQYNEYQLQEAHESAKKMYTVGRPQGARNKEKVKDSGGDSNTFGLPDISDAEQDDQANRDAAEQDQAESDAQNSGQTFNTSEFVTHKQLEAKEYINKRQLIDVVNKVGDALKDYVKDEAATLSNELNKRIDKIVAQAPTIVSLERRDLPPLDLGRQHFALPRLLRACMAFMRNQTKLCPWIYGPAGTGKSTAAEIVAKALNTEFRTMGQTLTKHDLLGFINTTGYQTTGFREAYENGYVFCGDEMDAWAQPAVVALNGALANKFCAFPDKIVARHPNFVFIAAANTVGSGATIDYVSRNKQDAASLDRFVYIPWPLDEALEDMLCGNKDWLKYVRHVRNRVNAANINPRPLITPRAAIYGEAMLNVGETWENVVESTLRKGLSDAQWNLIK